MASTYTTRIRLEKQEDGANPNSWGTVLNQNVIDLVDDAIAAYTTVSLSSVDVTLTNIDGQADQARSAFIELQGALTDNVNVVIPAKSKSYFIRNKTTRSSAETTKIKTLAGAGTAVGFNGNGWFIKNIVFVKTPDEEILSLDSLDVKNNVVINKNEFGQFFKTERAIFMGILEFVISFLILCS